MWDSITFIVVVSTILAVLLGFPFALVRMTENENKTGGLTHKAFKHYFGKKSGIEMGAPIFACLFISRLLTSSSLNEVSINLLVLALSITITIISPSFIQALKLNPEVQTFLKKSCLFLLVAPIFIHLGIPLVGLYQFIATCLGIYLTKKLYMMCAIHDFKASSPFEWQECQDKARENKEEFSRS